MENDEKLPENDSLVTDETAPQRRKLGQVDKSFYIIGVGASAGGLDAIKQLIGQAGPDFPHTFVIIQHISPDYKSLMPEILARDTKLTVSEVSDDMEVRPGHIYLIPPRSNVVIQGTEDDTSAELEPEITGFSGLKFSLVEPSPRPKLNLPIDLFFHSLAEAVGARSIAIILSGTGTDGSRGLRAVKDRDGFVMVQDPESAAFDGMPMAAIGTKLVDVVTTPDAMLPEIQRFLALREDGIINPDKLFHNADTEFHQLMSAVAREADLDFSLYKEPTLKRRIARRIGLKKFSTVAEYLEYVNETPSELSILHREFLVGVTNFFRDLPAWTYLEENVLEDLFARGDQSEPVKVWSVGCSTGEEAYSIAILLEYYRRANDLTRGYRVFATDVNVDSIRIAKQGIYPQSILNEIPEKFLNCPLFHFFDGTFKISKDVRDNVIFNSHDVTADPPYIKTDLVICRNLLIYLSPEVQKRIMSQFSFSLRQNGYLFLGAAENVTRAPASFEIVHQSAKIYRNTAVGQRGYVRPVTTQTRWTTMSAPRSMRLASRERNQTSGPSAAVLSMVLNGLEGCAIVIDDSGLVLETYGDYRKFFTYPEQGFSANLFDLISERLKSALLLGMHASNAGNSPHRHITRSLTDQKPDQVELTCQRIEWETDALAYLVILRDVNQNAATGGADSRELTADETDIIQRLEAEVEALQETLNITAEDLGVSNEELQTTNEELTVANEELQASNEEMQSINEELHTINAEHAEKILQLQEVQADVETLLNAPDVGIVLLDDAMSIRRFNLNFTRYVHVSEDDLGRQIASFNSELDPEVYRQILQDAEAVVNGGPETRREVHIHDGTIASCRVLCNRSASGDLIGALISFVDVTHQKLLQEQVEIQRDRLELLLEGSKSGYWEWDLSKQIQFISPGLKALFGFEIDQMADFPESWLQIVHPKDLGWVVSTYEAHLKTKGAAPYEFEARFFTRNEDTKWIFCRGCATEWDAHGMATRMTGIMMDIDALKEREMSVYREADDMRRYAFIAAHDLLQPVNTIDKSIETFLADKDTVLGEDSETVVKFLQTASGRMRDKINGLLEYSRHFDSELHLERCDLSEIVKDVLSDLDAQVKSAGAIVTVKPLPSADMDRGMISRVLQNLLSNSLKYRREDRPCEITVGRVPAPDGYVAFYVSDNGIGIPLDQRDSVFNLFSRLHVDSEYDGVGIGLALVARVIKLHGGKIAIEDGIDGGVSFVCTLQSD